MENIDLVTRIIDIGIAFAVLVLYIYRREQDYKTNTAKSDEQYKERIRAAEERADKLQKRYDLLYARYLVDLREIAKLPKPNGFEEDLEAPIAA